MPFCSAKRELRSFLSHFEASTCSGSAGTPRPIAIKLRRVQSFGHLLIFEQFHV